MRADQRIAAPTCCRAACEPLPPMRRNLFGLLSWQCPYCGNILWTAGGSESPERLPGPPTSAAPGTAAKIACMRRRAARGATLFHPDDCSGPVATRRRRPRRGAAADRSLRFIYRCANGWRVRLYDFNSGGEKQIYVGQYPTLDEAIAARDAALDRGSGRG